MSKVSVIGLGAMGSAIANAFLAAGHELSVWNRSPDKMRPFVKTAAGCAGNAAEAVDAGDVVVVCIDDYTATHELIEKRELGEHVEGRVLVQLSTGTPKQARGLEQWAFAHGARYLDGAILAYPREIGHEALIAVAGEKQTFDGAARLLGDLSSDIRYLGPSVGAAAALDVAVLSYYICTHLGLVHGALVCEAEDLRPDVFASVIADSMPSDVEEIRNLGRALQTGDFDNPGASVDVYSGVLNRILEQARDASINAEIAEFANSLYKRGIAAGLGAQEVVALTRVLMPRD